MYKYSILKTGLLAVVLGWFSILHAQTDERTFFVYDASNGMAANGAQTIRCTKTGRMVITTIGHINFYDGFSFGHIGPVEGDAYKLEKYTGHYHLMFDKHHHLWLKDKHQVTCVDLLTETFIHNVDSVFKSLGMNKTVDDMFSDHQSRLWFLCGSQLICTDSVMAVPVRQDVELHDVDTNGNLLLLFYADGTVSAYNLKTASHEYDVPAQSADEAQRYSNSSVIYPYEDGYYQIRNGNNEAELRYYDPAKRQWRLVLAEPYSLNNMAIYNGDMYIASGKGYWIYNLQTGHKDYVEELQLSKGRRLKTDINAIAFDLQGGMWIGTEKRGLLYAKPYPSPFKIYSWSDPKAMQYYQMMEKQMGGLPEQYHRPVNCVFNDSRGWKWTGMYTGLKLERTHKKPRLFKLRDGLRNEMVHAIVEDLKHDIWISTSYGISHLYIKKDSVYRIETYTSIDNVPAESFVNGMAARLDDGTILMNSLDHMVVFNPASFHHLNSEQFRLYPKLVKLMVDGQEISAGQEVDGRVIIDRAVTRVKEISVNYDQNSISLTFSGLNYFRPVQTYYRVRVKGVPTYNNWRIFCHANSAGLVDKNGKFHLPLLGLKPGRYEIELQTSFNPDDWAYEPYVWIINVTEPWWRASGVYLLLALVLLGLLIGNFIVYNRNTRLRLMRNNEEGDILRRIKTFATRCASLQEEVLTPYTLTQSKDGEASEGALMTPEFMEQMLKIVPYVNSLERGKGFTMTDLAELTGLQASQMYGLLSDHLDKNPRLLVGKLRLQEAAELLRTTDLSVEDIAERCRFVSPNYFIASFYHEHRMTPQDYRNSKAL